MATHPSRGAPLLSPELVHAIGLFAPCIRSLGMTCKLGFRAIPPARRTRGSHSPSDAVASGHRGHLLVIEFPWQCAWILDPYHHQQSCAAMASALPGTAGGGSGSGRSKGKD